MLSLENFIVCQRLWQPGYTSSLRALLTLDPTSDGGGKASAYMTLQSTVRGAKAMKAIVDGEVVANSDDVIECKGYQYFPEQSVRRDWLEKAAKTAADRACPHGVQFYDVIVGGKRHTRAAWSYEAPRPEMKEVGGRFGFWQDVKVA